MKLGINIQTGIISAEFDVPEFNQLMRALAGTATPPRPRRLPQVVTYYVGEYTQVYVVAEGGAYWACSCPDFRYRRQSPVGDPAWLNGACKHILTAGWGASYRRHYLF